MTWWGDRLLGWMSFAYALIVISALVLPVAVFCWALTVPRHGNQDSP
jgi:hypothetical protein